MPRSRQLAAIMFTDIQGYTALMQENEEKAILVRDKHRHIFNTVTEKHKGRILQYYGDGTLSIFDSAIVAVKCGIEMQLGFRRDPSIPVRIGIHTGDIIFSEEEIIGDSVNVASRIESLAVPGSVFISDKVYDEIKNQESLKTSLLKTFKLKNIEKPIEVYAISNVGLIVPKPEDIKGKTGLDASPFTGAQKQQKSEIQNGGSPAIILATKLYIPPSRPKVVLRPRLIERMNEGLHRKLILISAPAGFGKTTLASEWVTGCELPAAWISLDAGDNDPIRFLAYLGAALRSIFPNIGKRFLGMLQSPQPPPTESILMTMVNEITGVSDNFVLVLDDYHVIHAEQVDAALTFLVEHLPPQMHLVITTREDPHLPLTRLRVRSQLMELHVADLRFTASEAAEFLNQVMGLNLSVDNIASLEASTEGWVAGLQLAALSMQGREDIAGFVDAFAGDDRYILDYLVEEVLQNQPEHVQNFLLQTSILNRLTGPLCDVVTKQEEGYKMLEVLERSNLFIVPLDNRRRWYRYHHLFAEVLHTRLMEEQSNRVPRLHQRASEWYENNGLPAEAVHHALAAEDFVRAAGLVELAWPEMNKNCQDATWLAWVKALPEEMVHFRPVLNVGYAWALMMCGTLEGSMARLNDAEQWLDNSTNLSGGPNIPSAEMIIVDKEQFRLLPVSIANARAYHAQTLGDVPNTLKYTRQALDLVPADSYIERRIPTALLGFVHWENGDLEVAYQSFSDVMASFHMDGDVSIGIGLTDILADIRLAQGRLLEAVSIYKQSLKLVASQEKPLPMGTEDLYRGMSELLLERGDLEAAKECLMKTKNMTEKSTSMDWQYHLCLTQARQEEVQGDLESTLYLLDKAEKLYVISPMPNLRPVAALKTRVWIKQGNLDKALGWAEERDLSVNDELSYLREFEHIMLARVLVAQYKEKREDITIREAIELLGRLLEAAEKGRRMGSVLEILIQQALAFEAQDNISRTLVPLERALNLAEPEGYFRIFVDEGIPMARLLSEIASKRNISNYVNKLLNSILTEQQKQ